jgi:hypothetical protein
MDAAMTDYARTARLTELARALFPEQSELEVIDDNPADMLPWCAVAWDKSERVDAPLLVFECHHPRALDALEAALETLADEVHLADGSDGKSAHPKTLSECWRLIEALDRELLEAHENELRLSREAKGKP